jgi:prophage regulatory protein
MRAQPPPVFAQYLSSHQRANCRSVSTPHDATTRLRICGARRRQINLADAATVQRLTLTLEAYMNQQAIDTVIERRAPGDRADIRFIRLKEVMAICGKSRSSVYDAIKRGAFPRPVKLQGRSAAWIKSEVEQWAVQCIRTSRRDSKP